MFWNVVLVIGLSVSGISHMVPVVKPDICPPEGDHYLTHENCSKFIVCSNGYYHEFDCPQYTYWHPDKEQCDFDDSVCYRPTEEPTVTTERSTEPNPSDRPTDSPPTDGTTEPSPSDPPTESSSTEGSTEPNPSDPPTDAPPGSDPTTEPNSTDGPIESSDGTTENLFVCPSSGGHSVAHDSVCNLYYRCQDSNFLGLYSCGPEEWFDSESESCVAPEESDCPYFEYDDLSW